MTTFPIAETFWSLQGEGTFTGTPMHLAENDDCIDEFKLLVGEQTRLEDLERWVDEHALASRVFLQPIGEVSSVRQDNLKRCLEMLQKHPNWRLFAQLHKFLGER